MKRNLIYYLSILLIGTFIFLYSKNRQNRQVIIENNIEFSSKIDSSKKTATTPLNKFKVEELIGDYWNHPYVKENPELSDVALSLTLNDNNELEAQFLYYESMDSDGEAWGVQRDGGMTTLSPLSDSILIVNHPIAPFVKDFLYLIKTADQIGLSLDGETIAYYKNQHIIPDLSAQTAIHYLYGAEHETEEHHVKFGRIKQFTELGRTYALVFLEEYYNEAHGSRYGSNAVVLSVAKFEKKENGWHSRAFQAGCDCGYNGHSNDVILYPVLQKLGSKHFLFKKTEEEKDNFNTTSLHIYEVDDFREVLKVTLEQYQVNALGQKEYTIKHRLEFFEDSTECAIIIQDNLVTEDSLSFELKQDIYFFDEENNAFEKVR